MKKILELSTKDFLSGVSQVSHGTRGGLFFSAPGIAPFVSPRRTSEDFGLLQTFVAPVDMTGDVVKDEIQSWAVEATAASTGYLYAYGNGGNFYVIVLSSNAITNERASGSVIANPASGLMIYKEKLYYAQLTQIGQVTEGTPPFDTSSTWDDDWSTAVGGGDALTSFFYHPMHLFSGRVWIGNKFYIDSMSGTTPDYNSHVLTLETDFNVMCLEDDGFYLVIGITQNLGDTTIMAKTKIVFWDTYSSLASREWEIPEPNIIALKKMGGWLYAFTSGGMYRFGYGSPPQKILDSVSPSFGRYAGVDVLEGSMLVISEGTSITTYGSPMPNYPPATFTPFAGMIGNPTALISTAKRGEIYYATSSSKLYRQNVVTGGATGLAATTNFIQLPQKTKIEAIKIMLGTDLVSGDSLNIDVNADDGDTATDWGTVSFAKHGAVRRVTLSGSFDTEDLQLVLNFDAGVVKIRKIEVWGTPQPNALQ